MDVKLLLFSRIISIILAYYIINRVRKNILNEKESIFWVIGAFVMIVIAFFPKLLEIVSNFVGIQYPPATLFFVTILLLIVILYRQFTRISVLNEKVSELVRVVSILNYELEKQKNNVSK